MLKNTIKFQSFQKGWIPNTEVFPNGNPSDSAIDIVNFDVDSLKGGLVKTNGYSTDDAEYAASLSSKLGSHVIKHIHNYSFGIPLQADLLLAVAYYASGSPKYKWLIRDMIVNDSKLSSEDYSRWYNLLLNFTANVDSSSTTGQVTRLNISNISADGGEIVDPLDNMIIHSLDGFIVNLGSESVPVYRTVIYNDETYVLVTPAVVVADDTTVTFMRNRIQIDDDFDSIFNPTSQYSSFVVNNIMSKLMIGLGKEIKPLWLGYINRHYFYNKTSSKYLLDNDITGTSCQRHIVLEKRVPEFDVNFDIAYLSSAGSIKSATEIELAVTACFDGYQEVLPTTTQGDASNKKISLKLIIKRSGFNIFSGQEASPVTGIFQSGFYFKLLEGSTTKAEFRFIASDDWEDFIANIDLSANPNKVWIKADYATDMNESYMKINNMAAYIHAALSQAERTNEIYYIGSFTWSDLVIGDLGLAKTEGEYPYIDLTSSTEMEFTSGSEWKIESNSRFWDLFKTDSNNIIENTDYQDYYWFNDGELSPTIDENFFVIKLPNGYNSIQITLHVDPALFNRRITSYSIWGRYKPEDTAVSKWLTPFYQLKKIYINDTNIVLTNDEEYEAGLNAGWYINGTTFDYQTVITKIYGDESTIISADKEISAEILAELTNLKNIPQLLATLKYEPSVGIAAKYGAATIHNNTAWIADTDDKVEVLRFSRTGSTGTNNLDVFSYDFDSSIGFEMIGQDSPGHITALASKDDELIVLRDNSFFSIKTDIETISIKQCGNYVGCKYPRSLVVSRFGVIFADDNGIWLYQGLSSNSLNAIQINWQWDNYYKALTNKSGMFACWNGRTEEYWICIPDNSSGYTIYVADFKNIQSIDQSMQLMKDKEKILVPWRKKKFNATTVNSFAIDSYGKLIFADDTAIYFDNLNVYSMNGSEYSSLYVDSIIITQHSPRLKVYEVLTETLKDSSVSDWKFDLKLYVDGNATARQTVKMWGNCLNQDNLICVRPVNLGNVINDINMRIDMSSGNGTTVKKLRSFGVNILERKAKYVSE